ncbi:MAG TPA: hypothetical protein VIT91_16200 [Chthoniobacterales bacterium]
MSHGDHGENILNLYLRVLRVTTCFAHCTPAFLSALRALLADDYRDYRIQLCVYADQMDGKSYIGSMALSADSVLIEQKLHDLLHSNFYDIWHSAIFTTYCGAAK